MGIKINNQNFGDWLRKKVGKNKIKIDSEPELIDINIEELLFDKYIFDDGYNNEVVSYSFDNINSSITSSIDFNNDISFTNTVFTVDEINRLIDNKIDTNIKALRKELEEKISALSPNNVNVNTNIIED